MNPTLIERSKTFGFIDPWFNWTVRYADELSRNGQRIGFRAGVFYPNGALVGEHHQDWPPFFDSMAVQGVPYTSIHALFCYQKYNSCRIYLDSNGTNFVYP